MTRLPEHRSQDVIRKWTCFGWRKGQSFRVPPPQTQVCLQRDQSCRTGRRRFAKSRRSADGTDTKWASLHRSNAADCSLLAHSTDVEGGDGSVQAFEQKLSGGLDSSQRLNRGSHFAIDENLAASSFTAQAGR